MYNKCITENKYIAFDESDFFQPDEQSMYY